MRPHRMLIAVACATWFSITSGFSQGCSDSGFCTMGAVKPDQIYVPKISVRINAIELTQHFGYTKYGDQIHSTFLDINVGLLRRTTFQFRLPAYTTIRGNMPTTTGWGDYFINASHLLVSKDQYQVNLTVGAKLFNRAQSEKRSEEGKSMPLYQQTSLGSDDLIAGISIISRKWMLASAYKHPVNRVRNNFNQEQWIESPLYSTVQDYTTSAGLLPGADLMLRIERSFRFSQWSFSTGILNIYRLNRDEILDGNGNSMPLMGTQGLASNFLAGARYRFNIHSSVKLLAAVTLKERERNPDGLARDFVSQLAYEYRF
jgi:hypothetical protein